MRRKIINYKFTSQTQKFAKATLDCGHILTVTAEETQFCETIYCGECYKNEQRIKVKKMLDTWFQSGHTHKSNGTLIIKLGDK